MKIEPFAVEQWMDEHETSAKYNIAETCCASISITDLVSHCPMEGVTAESILEVQTKQTYGPVRGSPTLRSCLAGLYSVKGNLLKTDNILITPGAIAANFLVLYTLVHPGDHVICHYPTYQQLYSVPSSLGAEVDLWKARPEKKWELDINELKSMIKPNTKLLILNNPNNPTGAVIKRTQLQEIISVASENKITILSDEVYRPIFHSIGPMDAEFPSSMLSMSYDNVVVTGSLSKAYSLAGIRTGWIACRSNEIIEQCAETRHYSTISVSQLDQQVASFALSQMAIHGVLSRNIKLAKENLAVLEAFVNDHRECEWVRPVAGTTAFIKFTRDGKPVNAAEFCTKLQEETGVMVVPGDRCFGAEFEGYVRVGFVAEAEVLKAGIEALRKFMRTSYSDVPLMQ